MFKMVNFMCILPQKYTQKGKYTPEEKYRPFQGRDEDYIIPTYTKDRT